MAWHRGDVLGLAAPSLPLSTVPAQGFELWERLPEKKRAVKPCQKEGRDGEGEQQELLVVSWELSESGLSSLGTQGTSSHLPLALQFDGSCL